MNILLVYSDSSDPITESALSIFKNEKRFSALHIEQLLNDVEIFDVIEEGQAKISWTLPNGEKITNSPDTFLLNRVLGVSDKLFEDFIDEDKSYAKEEFSAYLIFALSAFENATTPPGHLGMCGNLYPLPIQWKKLKYAIPELRTPAFYYGKKEFCTFDLSKSDLVVSDIFNTRHWKTNPSSADFNDGFIFQRPQGQPVFVTQVFDEFHCRPFNKDFSISKTTTDRLLKTSSKIAQTFRYRFSETLFFVQNDEFIFGSTSPYLQPNTASQEFIAHQLKSHIFSLYAGELRHA